MLHRIKNNTIGLGLELHEHENDFYSRIQILDAKDGTFPRLLLLPKPIKGFILVVFWLPLSIGTYFRFIAYKYLFEQYKKKELTPVNKLCFAVISTDHLNHAWGILSTTFLILNGESLHLVAGGNWYCAAQTLYSFFAFYYSFIGSLGVSIYRILLIKHNYFLKDVIGEKVMLSLIFYGGILLTLVFVTILYSHDYNSVIFSTCAFVPKNQVLQILDEYEQSRGNLSILSYYVKVHVSNGIVMAFIIFCEIIIYVIFFYYMYKHDNNDRLRRLLEPTVIKGRNRRNAISFIGQLISFLLELIGVLLMVIAYTNGSSAKQIALIGLLFRRYSFTIMSMVEVLTSAALRSKIFKIDLNNIIFGLN
jgi:hypothetical protein